MTPRLSFGTSPPMGQPIEGGLDPILAYTTGAEIEQLQWSSSQPDWVAIAFSSKLQILRFHATRRPLKSHCLTATGGDEVSEVTISSLTISPPLLIVTGGDELFASPLNKAICRNNCQIPTFIR
ncbi:hypothetical protein RJ640_007708 [Escallonia rubra]|uniref:Uncharacterized protein n=1 Tax=Escallonia rubra TaxID=112253 RepID=A0AA88RSQ6_9ASTE|nr:hypothetical protein RJ640_007708 [Escallonia rubra]